MIREYFSVQLSDSIHLGLPLADMITVTQFERQKISLVPGVASFWYGVVNFKGSLLWVLDTERLFYLDAKSDPAGICFAGRSESQNRPQKPVAVVLSYHIEGTQRRVALVVKKLKGIVGIESNKLQSVANSTSSIFKNICTTMAEQDNHTLYILNSQVFLQQLYQQSTL